MPLFKVPQQSVRWLFAELVVVVLGILIAFQIDEWNSQRQLRSEEVTALNGIRQDLLEQYETNESALLVYNRQLDFAIALAEYLFGNVPITASAFGELWLNTVASIEWRNSSPTYQGLKETNRLSLISNPDLSRELFTYHEELVPGIQYNVVRVLESRDAFREASFQDIFVTALEPLQNSGEYELVTISLSFGTLTAAVRLPVEENMRSSDFIAYLSNLSARLSPSVATLATTQTIIQELVAAIDRELGQPE